MANNKQQTPSPCLVCAGEGEFDCEACEDLGEINGVACDACTGIGVEECEGCESSGFAAAADSPILPSVPAGPLPGIGKTNLAPMILAEEVAAIQEPRAKQLLDQIVAHGRDTRVTIEETEDEFFGVIGTVGSGKSVPSPMHLGPDLAHHLHNRLAPAVVGEDVDRLLPQLEQVRDQITALMPPGADRDAVAGDVRRHGYRVLLHRVRRTAGQESTRVGLMLLELALTQLADGRAGAAQAMLARARTKLS